MQALHRLTVVTLLFAIVSSLSAPMALAHLMVAQHGTLNVVEGDVFMVLSLPVSAFEGVDADGDGEISMIEFNNHRDLILGAIQREVVLSDEKTQLAMQGLLLSPVVPHDAPGASIAQLVVMARIPLSDPTAALRFHVGLYGNGTGEQSLEITASRDSDKQQVVFELSALAPVSTVF